MDAINALIDSITYWLSYFLDHIRSTIGSTLLDLGMWFQTVYEGVMNFIGQVWLEIKYYFHDLVTAIGSMISGLFADIREVVIAVISTITNYFAGLFNEVKNFITQIYMDLKVVLLAVVDEIKTYVVNIYDTIKDLVSAGLNELKELAKGINDAIKTYIMDLLEGPKGAIKEIAEILGEAWEKISELKVGITDSMHELSDNIEKYLTEIKDDYKEAFKTSVEGISKLFTPISKEKVAIELNRLATGEDIVKSYRAFTQWVLEAGAPNNVVGQALLIGTIFVLGLIPTSLGALSIMAEPQLQELRMQFPTVLLPPADCVAAWKRQLMSEESAITTIRKQGYSEADANRIFKLQTIVPTGPDLIHLYLRQLIDKDAVINALQQQGYEKEWSEPLIEAAQYIPGPQDLVWMAVREMFTPAIYEAFNQLEGFPEAIVEHGAKVGLSRFWLEKYWGAHWSLPSPQQGFEMLHREEIRPEELELLLKALDIMPHWRQPLINIAYQPLTRVDVRRMHKLGVLSESGVNKAYHDLGYNDTNAELMTKFTLEYNKPRVSDDETEIATLSRSNITGFYADGIISRDSALAMIIELGYTPHAAELFLASIEFDRERKLRRELVKLALDLYDSGAITYEEAERRLRDSGLETIEVQRALQDLYNLSLRRMKWPSMSDLASFYKLGLITTNQYQEGMQRLGYTDFWISKYQARIDLERKNA